MKVIEFLIGRLTIIVALLMVLVLFSGCWGSMNEEFVKAVDSNWKVVGKDYRDYLANDKDLPEASKQRRLKTVDEFDQLVKEAVEEANK